MDKRITELLKEEKVTSLAVLEEGVPYVAPLFYCFNEDDFSIIFLSSAETRHIKSALKFERVAGSILAEDSMVTRLRGLQFQGTFLNPEITDTQKLYKIYQARFPFTKLVSESIWQVNLTYIKMTDNRLGFGKKLLWERAAENAY